MINRLCTLFAIVFLTVSTAPVIAGSNTVQYEPGVIKAMLAKGETVFVDYAADWCSTCKRQERVINQLRSNDPAYNSAITFVRVDWDMYQDDAVRVSHKIPRRSTLILLRGGRELGRIVAGTRTAAIKALLDQAL